MVNSEILGKGFEDPLDKVLLILYVCSGGSTPWPWILKDFEEITSTILVVVDSACWTPEVITWAESPLLK